MFSIFKKKRDSNENINTFEVELTASVLAYEIARSDGKISASEEQLLLEEVSKISRKIGKDEKEIIDIIEIYSKDSISFHDFIKDINEFYSMEEKLSLIEFLWDVAYADSKLDVDEERLIRRVASLINLKDINLLKLKHKAKTK
jgi:uncharacterized tellurite resistance protein B-like protein